MSTIDAVYQRGVFRPLGRVALPDNQRVRLAIEPLETINVLGWLADLQRLHSLIVARQGVLPDSAHDIAADRLRDA